MHSGEAGDVLLLTVASLAFQGFANKKTTNFLLFWFKLFFPLPFQEVYALYNFQFHVAVITWWTRSPRWVSDQRRLQIGSDKQTSYLAAGPLASDAFPNKLRISEWLSNGFTESSSSSSGSHKWADASFASELSHGNNKEESWAHKWCLVVIGSSDHLSWQRSLNCTARFDPDLKEFLRRGRCKKYNASTKKKIKNSGLEVKAKKTQEQQKKNL